MEFIRLKTTLEIKKEIDKYNDMFTRHIDTRVCNIHDYAEKLYTYALNYKIVKNGKEMGFFSFYMNDFATKYAYLTLIVVLPENRSDGIGSSALQYIYKKCVENGFNILKLEVDKTNEAAISFYKKNGFVRVEDASKKSFYMEKEIRDVSVGKEGDCV